MSTLRSAKRALWGGNGRMMMKASRNWRNSAAARQRCRLLLEPTPVTRKILGGYLGLKRTFGKIRAMIQSRKQKGGA